MTHPPDHHRRRATAHARSGQAAEDDGDLLRAMRHYQYAGRHWHTAGDHEQACAAYSAAMTLENRIYELAQIDWARERWSEPMPDPYDGHAMTPEDSRRWSESNRARWTPMAAGGAQ